MKNQNYVVGFLFSADRREVALIRKQKPAWQAGLLNGVGGKVEDGESAIDAMCREFGEETGLHLSPVDWQHFCTMRGNEDDDGGKFQVDFFVGADCLNMLVSQEAEKLEIVHTHTLHPLRPDVVENLPWLVSLAIDSFKDGRPAFTTVEYP